MTRDPTLKTSFHYSSFGTEAFDSSFISTSNSIKGHSVNTGSFALISLNNKGSSKSYLILLITVIPLSPFTMSLNLLWSDLAFINNSLYSDSAINTSSLFQKDGSP